MIPKVRTWKVTYWSVTARPIVNGIIRKRLASCEVQTINKRFAKWGARDIIGYPIQYHTASNYVHITVSLSRSLKDEKPI